MGKRFRAQSHVGLPPTRGAIVTAPHGPALRGCMDVEQGENFCLASRSHRHPRRFRAPAPLPRLIRSRPEQRRFRHIAPMTVQKSFSQAYRAHHATI
jgi:hypothetical protein